jgi:hypothetical protein
MSRTIRVTVESVKQATFSGDYLDVPPKSGVLSSISELSMPVDAALDLSAVVENARPWPKRLATDLVVRARDQLGRRIGRVIFKVLSKTPKV